jgi:hypothetical protein
MRATLIWLVLCLLLGSPAWSAPPTITVSGSAAFPAVTLTGDLVTKTGLTSTPTFRLTSNTNIFGFNVTLQTSNFVNGSSVIPAANLRFTANGGTISRISGENIVANGPRETGNSGSLDTPLKCVTSTFLTGIGVYDWIPSSANFEIDVPATALVGTYVATLTATITTGP